MSISEVWSVFEEYREARLKLLAAIGPSDSQRDPLTDLGEWLVYRLMGGTLAPSRTQRGHDVISPTGERVQVKTLANPAGVDRNAVGVEFKEGVDRFAVVLFEDFVPRAVVIFRRGSLRELNRVLGNRPTKADPEVTLSLRLRHVALLLSDSGALASLGIEVFHPAGAWTT